MKLLPPAIREFAHHFYRKAECSDPHLLYLFLEITKLCNLVCRHCGSDCSADTSFQSLTTDSWIKILEDISQRFSPLPTIVLTGGEPLRHPDFALLVSKLKEYGFRWGMVSNGYALEESTVDTLLKNDMYSITISLDGTERSHNWLRGKTDAYQRATAALRLLTKSSVPEMDVVTCVNPRNCNELDSVADTLVSLGVPAWRLFRIFPAGRAKDNDLLLLSGERTKQLLKWIAVHRKLYSRRGLRINYSCEGWVPFNVDDAIRDQPFFCRAGINIASILCDGTITGCTNNAERFHEGNVLRERFSHVWKNGFRQFRDRSWVHATECGTCSDIDKCQGSSIHLWRENPMRPSFCYR